MSEQSEPVPYAANRTRSPRHRDLVVRALWQYADRHREGELDGGDRPGRPPVLAREFATNNVLVPTDHKRADDIRAAIPISKHHRWFRSMTSSQALTQSVFAAVREFGRLDLLEGLASESGQPAFFDDTRDWVVSFEHDVSGLNEPRPTSVDVLLSRPGQRVAIECKFLEDQFGICSRTNIRAYPDPKNHCDGNYRLQSGRSHRCALTEIGIRYWDLLPHLFDWPSHRDHEPCPFGATYQLARNALAATVTPDGRLNASGGHVLVMYDDRNPAFRPGGKAHRRWQLVEDACAHQGLFRLLTWQRLLISLARAPELKYLVIAVREKYGLKPD